MLNNNPFLRLKRILTPSDFNSMLFILMILFISGIFETLGIASIIPFINIVADENYQITNTYAVYVIDMLSLNPTEAKILIGALVISLFVFINLFNIYSAHRTLYFVARIEHSISTRVMESCLLRPYQEHIEQSPSQLTKHILEDAGALCSGIIYPLIQIASKTLIIILISVLLIIVDYKIFLSSFFIFSLIYFFIYKKFTKIAKEAGEQRVIINDDRYKTTRDVLDALKEVRFYSVENNYINKFSDHAKEFSLVDAKINFFSVIPRYIIEIIVFGIIFSSILIIIGTDSQLKTYLPIIGVFVIAAYRAIPMLQNVYINLNLFRFYQPIFEIIENLYRVKKINVDSKKQQEQLKFSDNIEFKDINFSHKGQPKIITNLNCKIYHKSITALIGSTGSGKTSLIDILLGFYKPSSGTIFVDGNKLTEDLQNAFNNGIGYVTQSVNLQQNTIAENIALGMPLEQISIDKVYEILKVVELDSLIQNLAKGVHTNIGDRGTKLSGGQRQRIGIARALYSTPNILVFDESTNELDAATETKILKNIRLYLPEITIIMITHRLSSLKHADRILLFSKNVLEDITIKNNQDIGYLEDIIDINK